jgi:hypothetical protein
MAEKPPQEFGKRRPVTPLPPGPPVKRSGHVALLLMGTLAVGGGGYALIPVGNCAPTSPGMAAPGQPQSGADCASRGSSSGSGGHGSSGGYWSRSNFFGGDTSANRSSSGTTSDSGSGNVTRGGFGSFARAFSVHFSSGS